MLDQLEKIVSVSKLAADAVKTFPGEIRVVSHYDADGITSAAIITRALRREGKSFQLTLLKQLNEDNVKDLVHYKKDRMFIFSDFGSGMLDSINNHLKNAPIIILDHHQQEKPGELATPNIIEINPVKLGISGNISASGVSYLFARAMDPQNRDLSHLAIIGAVGDSQMGAIGPNWGLMGLNAEILKDAQEMNKIKVGKGLRLWGRYSRPIHKALEYSTEPFIPGVSGSEAGAVQLLQEAGIEPRKSDGAWKSQADLTEKEQQRLADLIIMERIRHDHPNPDWIFGDVYELLSMGGELRDAAEVATTLNATGKAGSGHMGVLLCMGDTGILEDVKSILEKHKRALNKAAGWIREHHEAMLKTERADYIVAGDNISEHMISNVVSIINHSTNTGKPVFGIVNAEDGVKVSARASDALVRAGLNLKELVANVVKETGGQGGGHSGASGATIPRGAEKKFMQFMEAELERVNVTVGPAKGRAGAEPGTKKPAAEAETTAETDVAGENNIKDINQNVSNQKIPSPALMPEKKVLNGGRQESGQETGGQEEVGQERGSPVSGQGTGSPEAGEGRGIGRKKGDAGEKVERKGLVRYLKP